MIDILTYGFMQKAFIAGILIAIACAIVGMFIVLRRMAPLGDGLAHIAFGGVAIGFFFGAYPLLISLILCILSVLGISYLRKKKVYGEVGVAVFYSFGLALGIIFLSLSHGFSVDLHSYLFGSILSISQTDLLLIIGVFIAVLVFTLPLLDQLFYMSFDEESAKVSGIKTKTIDIIFNIIVAITVVVALRIVGILLVSSLLVIPAATALLFAKGCNRALITAILISVIGVIAGITTSYYADIAAGGSIIMILCLFFFGAILIKNIYSAVIRRRRV